jgi:hypothetical protein
VDQANITDPSAPMGANAFVARCAADVTRDARAYCVDACRRAVLFADVLQHRSQSYRQQAKGLVDERGFNLLRHLREAAGKGLSLEQSTVAGARACALEASLNQSHRHNMGA